MDGRQLILTKTTLTNCILNSKHIIHSRLGFTLAEVLITLVIIGIIAAMTVPTLMTNTNSQEYRSGLKKAIATLNQGIKMQYALNGTMVSDFSGSTPTQIRDTIFAQRLNVLQSDTNATTYGGVAGNSSTANFYTADGMKFGVVATTTTGAAAGTCDTGSLSPCFGIFIDVNGNKQPNSATTSSTHPNDVYTALLYAQRVIPYGNVSQEVMYDK